MTDIISKSKLLEWLKEFRPHDYDLIWRGIETGAFNVATDADVAEIEKALERTEGLDESVVDMTYGERLAFDAIKTNHIKWLHTLLAKLAEKDAEIERLRAERDGYYNNAKYTEASFHEVTRLRAELEKWEAEARLQYRLHNEMIEKERECREKLNQALEALEWVRDAGTDYQSISKARQALQSIRGGESE